jgi:hypothetical protein
MTRKIDLVLYTKKCYAGQVKGGEVRQACEGDKKYLQSLRFKSVKPNYTQHLR